MSKLLHALSIIVLALSYILVYDLARDRKANECRDEVEIRNVQIRSMIMIEKRLKSKGFKIKDENL